MHGVAITSGLLELGLCSTAAAGLPLAVLQRLARHTLEVNPRFGLTGELRFADGRFSLLLEGRGEVLLPLAARILADPRHRAIAVTAFGGIAERRFADWSAAGFGLDEAPAGFPTLRFTPACAGPAAHLRARIV
jgi:hypothetical protein